MATTVLKCRVLYVSHSCVRVNPGDALDCSLYGDLRIAEEEPEEEPEEDFSSNHNLFFITLLPTGSTVDIVVSTKESWSTYRQD